LRGVTSYSASRYGMHGFPGGKGGQLCLGRIAATAQKRFPRNLHLNKRFFAANVLRHRLLVAGSPRHAVHDISLPQRARQAVEILVQSPHWVCGDRHTELSARNAWKPSGLIKGEHKEQGMRRRLNSACFKLLLNRTSDPRRPVTRIRPIRSSGCRRRASVGWS
jgi:hypothetical protein